MMILQQKTDGDSGKSSLPKLNLAKYQCRIGAAEAERIRHDGADFHVARFIRHVIQIALLILIVQIDGRRRDLVLKCQHREHRFDTARRTE